LVLESDNICYLFTFDQLTLLNYNRPEPPEPEEEHNIYYQTQEVSGWVSG